MAKVKRAKLKVKVDWNDTLTSMEIGQTIEAPLDEKSYAARIANYLKSTGAGDWTVNTLRDSKKISVTRNK